MVPLDDETVALIDRITATRSTAQPLPHPRTGAATQFLFTHHGRRLSQTAVRTELARSADTAGIGHVTPHQLRHTTPPPWSTPASRYRRSWPSWATPRPR